MHSDIHSDMGEVFFALCKKVDSPVSLGAWLRYKYSHAELASMEINPRDYTNADSFKLDYSVVSLLLKWKGLKTNVDLDDAALQKFTLAEVNCAETNKRFRRLETVRNGRLHGYLHSAQRKISSLLGPFSRFCIDQKYGWGPGACLGIPKRRAFIDTKMCELPITVSRSARSLLRNEIETDLHWSASILKVIPDGPYCLLDSVFHLEDACRIDTVPKNAKTNRVIAVEPRGNSFLQKGFGGYIRSKLRTVGVNLDDQTVNQRWASQAHRLGLATLDLKAASDTVSKEVVYHLLPYDWASSMDAVRSRKAVMPSGSTVVLEKFSSMGNGFTFELESLIFWALASSVSEAHVRSGVVAVYGDDIIVDSSITTELCLLLQFCGFEVNDQKSFFSGRFFESCGKHYFDDVDVTPAYQKEELNSVLERIRFGNRLIRLAGRFGGRLSLNSSFETAWRANYRLGFHLFRGQIPFGASGDDAWLVPYDDFDLTDWNLKQFHIDSSIRCRVLSERNRRLFADDRSLLAWSLRKGVGREASTWLDILPDGYWGEVEVVHKPAKLVVAVRAIELPGEFDAVWH